MLNKKSFKYPLLCLIATLLSVTAVGIGCGDDNNTTSVAPPPPAEQPAQTTVTVNIPVGAMNLTDDAYGTNPLVIQQGTTVKWTNGDTVEHTATSDTGVWDSGNIAPGSDFSFKFDNVGSFPYHCTIHPGMVGEIKVEAGPSPSPSPSTSPSPSPEPSESPSPSPSASTSPSPSPSPSASRTI